MNLTRWHTVKLVEKQVSATIAQQKVLFNVVVQFRALNYFISFFGKNTSWHTVKLAEKQVSATIGDFHDGII